MPSLPSNEYQVHAEDLGHEVKDSYNLEEILHLVRVQYENLKPRKAGRPTTTRLSAMTGAAAAVVVEAMLVAEADGLESVEHNLKRAISIKPATVAQVVEPKKHIIRRPVGGAKRRAT